MPYFYFTKQLAASPIKLRFNFLFTASRCKSIINEPYMLFVPFNPSFLVLNIKIPEGVLMLPKMSVEPPDIVMWSFGGHRI